nr:ECF transporter S component [Candidatus Sigynarchaeota archaeon]
MMQQQEKRAISSDLEKPRRYSTRDLVVIAILAALGNVISSMLDLLKPLFKASPVPFFQLFGGYHLIWMALAFGITKKYGAPTFTAAIKGILEFFFWDPFFGVWVILLNLLEGAMIDVGFYIGQYIKSERRRWILAGLTGNTFQPIVSYSIVFYYLGKPFPDPTILLIAMGFAVVSGALIAGLLGYQLDKVLHRSDVQAFISSH